jgi:salicylate hydroxylase
MHNWKDGTINDVYDLSDYKEKWGYVYNMFHRIDLHEQLQIKAKALGVKIVVDHKAIDVDCINRTITFDTGTTICVDLIIGADGVRSTVRSLIGIAAKTTQSTSACYRCIIPTLRVKQLGLKDFAPNNAIEFWGGFGIHKIVLAPCCAGEIVSFYCFYPASHNDQSEEGWNFSVTPSMLSERFPDLDPDLLAIFKDCEDIKLWKLVIHEPYPYWVKGCVALLGDAAHPMLPDQSQGACMAIEDAAALGIIFSAEYWGNKIHTVEHGLKMYEMLRKSRATRVQEASARARENLNERIGWSSQRNHGNQQNATTKLTIDEINTYDMKKHLDNLLN